MIKRLDDYHERTICEHVSKNGYRFHPDDDEERAIEIIDRTFFDAIASDPVNWEFCGERLMSAASLLSGQADLQRVYLMLVGYAIENFAKGILLGNRTDEFLIDGQLKHITNHDCLALVNKTGIKLTEGERETLKCLTQHIVWYGRYPVRKNFESVREKFPATLMEDTAHLVAKLKAALTEEIERSV